MAEVDISEFTRLARPKKKLCPVGAALKALKPDRAAKLEAACDESTDLLNTGAIVEWMQVEGFPVNVNAVTSHRRKTCSCNGS